MDTTSEEIVEFILNLNYKLIKKLNDNFIFFPKNLNI